MTTNGRGGGAPMMPFFQRGQTEKFSGGADENLSLVLKQTTALIALGVWGVIIVTTGLWMVGSTLPIAIVSGGCLLAGYIGVRFVKAYFPEPSWAISIIAVVGVMAFALLTGTQIVMDNWPAPCTWRWEVKGIVWAIQAVVLEALWLTRYRFKYEIVDPKAQPTFQPRSGEEGVRWPSSPFDGMLEGVEELMEEPSRPLPPARSLPRPIPQSGVPTARVTLPVPERLDNGSGDGYSYSASNGNFEAPSGAIRTRQDLAEFVQSLGSGTREAKFKAWESKTQGRDHGWWGDMVDVAAMFGLVTPRKGGTKIRVLRQDWRVILREIEQGLD